MWFSVVGYFILKRKRQEMANTLLAEEFTDSIGNSVVIFGGTSLFQRCRKGESRPYWYVIMKYLWIRKFKHWTNQSQKGYFATFESPLSVFLQDAGCLFDSAFLQIYWFATAQEVEILGKWKKKRTTHLIKRKKRIIPRRRHSSATNSRGSQTR